MMMNSCSGEMAPNRFVLVLKSNVGLKSGPKMINPAVLDSPAAPAAVRWTPTFQMSSYVPIVDLNRGKTRKNVNWEK